MKYAKKSLGLNTPVTGMANVKVEIRVPEVMFVTIMMMVVLVDRLIWMIQNYQNICLTIG